MTCLDRFGSRGGSAALVVLLSLATFVDSPTALAQTGDANAEARVFFQRGNRLSERARRSRGARRTQLFEEALEAYVSTIQIVPSRNALFNAGFVLEELERHADAFAYYQRYLAIDGLSEDERVAGNERIDAVRPHVAIVEVTSTPSGASVYVDRLDLAPRGTTPVLLALQPGQHNVILRAAHHADLNLPVDAALGQTATLTGALIANPVEVRFEVVGVPDATIVVGEARTSGGALTLTPGTHTARIEAEGREAAERTFEVPPGESYTARLSPGGAIAAVASLRVEAPEGAEVHIDGMLIGTGPTTQSVAPGSHRVTVSAAGRAELEQVVVVMAGQTATLHPELAASGERRFGPLPHILLGVTVAGLGAFAGLALKASHENDVLSGMDGESMQRIDDQVDVVEQWNRRADIVLGVSFALAVSTTVFYLLNRPREGRSRGRVELSLGGDSDSAALQLRGAF